ncbi:hypothetical protein GCM10022258_42930 [Aquimarina gracilis]
MKINSVQCSHFKNLKNLNFELSNTSLKKGTAASINVLLKVEKILIKSHFWCSLSIPEFTKVFSNKKRASSMAIHINIASDINSMGNEDFVLLFELLFCFIHKESNSRNPKTIRIR